MTVEPIVGGGERGGGGGGGGGGEGGGGVLRLEWATCPAHATSEKSAPSDC